MKHKTLWIILLSLALVLTAAALVACDTLANSRVVASAPLYDAPSEEIQVLETIEEPAIPHAGQQTTVQQITVVSAVVRQNATVEAPVSEAPVTEAPAPEAPIAEEPVQEEPAQEAPVAEEPVQEEPAKEEPVVKTTAASRLLERANTLLAQLFACKNNTEKRALLEAPNNSLGNDAIRTKLLADLGGSWEQLEAEVVAATEYQQGKTLYVQVFVAGTSSSYEPVVYTTQNSDRSGNQWATNLVYDDETATWMEYTQKHAYNNSRVGYYLTGLYNEDGAWDELKDTMETSDVWQPVEVPAESETAPEAPAADAAE